MRRTVFVLVGLAALAPVGSVVAAGRAVRKPARPLPDDAWRLRSDRAFRRHGRSPDCAGTDQHNPGPGDPGARAPVPAGARRDVGQRPFDQHRVEARHGRRRFRQSVWPDSRQARGESARGRLPAGQVEEIYITLMHADHVGGLAADGRAVFQNAIVLADQREADYWLSPKNLEAAPADAKSFFEGAMVSMRPYIDTGRFRAFDGDTDLVPGVRALATRGHTSGHAAFVVESRGQKLVLWGGLMHVAAVQFPEPSVTIQFDTDSKAAAAQRKKAFAAAAKQGQWVGASHLPFPGWATCVPTAAVTTGSRRTTACRVDVAGGGSSPRLTEETRGEIRLGRAAPGRERPILTSMKQTAAAARMLQRRFMSVLHRRNDRGGDDPDHRYPVHVRIPGVLTRILDAVPDRHLCLPRYPLPSLRRTCSTML